MIRKLFRMQRRDLLTCILLPSGLFLVQQALICSVMAIQKPDVGILLSHWILGLTSFVEVLVFAGLNCSTVFTRCLMFSQSRRQTLGAVLTLSAVEAAIAGAVSGLLTLLERYGMVHLWCALAGRNQIRLTGIDSVPEEGVLRLTEVSPMPVWFWPVLLLLALLAGFFFGALVQRMGVEGMWGVTILICVPFLLQSFWDSLHRRESGARRCRGRSPGLGRVVPAPCVRPHLTADIPREKSRWNLPPSGRKRAGSATDRPFRSLPAKQIRETERAPEPQTVPEHVFSSFSLRRRAAGVSSADPVRCVHGQNEAGSPRGSDRDGGLFRILRGEGTVPSQEGDPPPKEYRIKGITCKCTRVRLFCFFTETAGKKGSRRSPKEPAAGADVSGPGGAAGKAADSALLNTNTHRPGGSTTSESRLCRFLKAEPQGWCPAI